MNHRWAIILGVCSALFFTTFAEDSPKVEEITEISFQRPQCCVFYPVDRFVLRKDGTASYTGNVQVSLIGEYTGTINQFFFRKLAGLVVAANLFGMENSYGKDYVDGRVEVTTIATKERSKSITNKSCQGPLSLWGVDMAIIGLSHDIKRAPISSGIQGTIQSWDAGPPRRNSSMFQQLV